MDSRRWLFRTTCVALLAMVAFYWRHNEYCEPYVYSFFCISEYVVVLTNIAFHMTAYYDFHHLEANFTNRADVLLPRTLVDVNNEEKERLLI